MENEPMRQDEIESKIITLRGTQVMLDRDLAELYGVETRVLNQSVKRNIGRFPADFCFQLDEREFAEWKSQIVMSNSDRMGLRRPPYAFTEQGVAMLSSVLRSESAIDVNIRIMRAFVSIRHFVRGNARVFTEIDSIRHQLLETAAHQKEADKRIDELFDRMDKYKIDDTQGIFFQGQIFDAYAKF